MNAPMSHADAEVLVSFSEEVERLRQSNAELLKALKEALAAIEEETNNQDGRDFAGIECGYCYGAAPVAHSDGCRWKQAIRRAEKKVSP